MAVKPLQKSSIRGVHITQFVDKIPKGCSTPDFERKPVSLTLQEGKNAIFRAVVKGVPAPEVKWKRAKGEINDPAKYLMFYSPATSEHILQINKITAGDSDLYRCFAVNEYGEASCSAGLRIIQGRIDNLKKSLQDLKKTLKKRAPLPKQKVLDKEAIFQLLLHADKKDYERICIKYGISDFRGMLRALQDLKKDTENEQAKLIHSIRNMEHIKVNKDGSASFSLEMDLKSASSNIYLLKDGEKVRYGTGDEYRKYYLRQIGKKYHFIVNDVHPEDAGLYQVRVEDVPIFSTELDAESIPVRFQKPLTDLRCHEEEDVIFECVLRTPCYDAAWLHKAHPLEASEKHQISVSPDGLIHQLIIKNAVTSDSGLYTLDTGLCSSRAWLLVERKWHTNNIPLTVLLILTTMDGVSFEKEGLVHKLIISKAEDIHAGKYRFEAGDIKTEASIFVEGESVQTTHVDEILLKNLMSVPTVAKAGEKVVIKIPFEGRLPVRAMWLKDKIELGDDSRVRVDKTDTFTMLSISSAERKDCGDYKVRLKNDSGILDIDLKVEVIDKPQPPAGPLKIVGSSAHDVTIQWNPPKDDGGKPIQNYVIEKQQVGKSNWVTLGEIPRSCTTFTTSKVEQDMSYYFRVRAVNAEGTSEALESDEVVTISKASPGAPDPPEIIGVSKDTITISWKAPRKTGGSRISGYIVQKRKKGSMTWVPVNSVPIKLKITDLKKGLQYEFCVAAVNASGMGDISAPSEAAFARDSTKPPGKVRDLKMTISDSSSVTLTWNAPEAEEGSGAKGYNVEMRSSNSLSWTKCNIFPIETTTYKVKGLHTKETYFLRVRAINDCGPGEATELEAFTEVVPPVVSPRFIIDKTVKNFLVIKAGNAIRVNIPFEAPPDFVLTWLKDGVPLPSRAKISTQDGTSQLLIRAAEFTDSGIYTVELMSGTGKRETFSFQVQVTDIPQPPGPIELRENVPNIVTVTWEPSTSEKRESNLFYTVLKRESQKGLWHVVGDLIYTNKFTYTKVIPGRDYYFRVVAKNHLGSSRPSDTVQPWRIRKQKADIQVRPQRYKGVNQNQPPRFLVPLKPHVVTTGSECRMSCAVGGHPPPKITWYKDGRDLSNNPSYFGTNDFGVCSLVIFGVSKADEGDYTVEATNDSGRAFSKASLTVKGNSL
uniref:Immunoglobulin superfamily member 22 n=1 Tax=Phasianus colchicus TaxID=9054 RepID=A0A669QMR5_PHACC